MVRHESLVQDGAGLACLSPFDKASVLRERGNGRQRLAFQPFKKGAAGSGDIAEVPTETSRIERRHGVAAPGDRREAAMPHEPSGLAHKLIGSFADGLA